MIDKLSTIIFLIGILILTIPNIMLLSKKSGVDYKQLVTLNIYTVISVIIILFAWFLRETKAREQYDYNRALRTGYLAGGTVFVSYPDNVPGLGWI